jgi:hypothetical protein
MRQLSQTGHPAIVYLHPYEVEPEPLIQPLPGMSWKQNLEFRFFNFHQCVGRHSVERKIRWLLKHYRFGTIEQLIAALQPQEAEAPALAGASRA